MPLYHYQCLACRRRHTLVAGLDDHTALCPDCGGLLLRLDQDPFLAYFDLQEHPAQERILP